MLRAKFFLAAILSLLAAGLYPIQSAAYEGDDPKAVGGDFDPDKGPWSNVWQQHYAREKQRLIDQARAMDAAAPLRADYLLTAVICYGVACTDAERKTCGLEALDILSHALDAQSGKPGRNQRIPEMEQQIRKDLDVGGSVAAHALRNIRTMDSWLAQSDNDLREKSLVWKRREAPILALPVESGKEAVPNLVSQYELFAKNNKPENAKSSEQRVRVSGHALAKSYLAWAGKLNEIGQYDQAVAAANTALKIDEKFFPDRNVAVRDYIGSGCGVSSPLARDHLVLGEACMGKKQYDLARDEFKAGLRICEAAMEKPDDKSLYMMTDHESLETGLAAAMRLALQK